MRCRLACKSLLPENYFLRFLTLMIIFDALRKNPKNRRNINPELYTLHFSLMNSYLLRLSEKSRV